MQDSRDTWFDVLSELAEQQGDRGAVTMLTDGQESGVLSFADLHRAACSTAAALQAAAAESEPVLILAEPGLDYLKALWGCIYAGAIAVPAYPPDPFRLKRTLPRLSALVADCHATTVLATARVRDVALALDALPQDLRRLRWLCVDEVSEGLGERYQTPDLESGNVLLLQYTSGSTQLPRGVVLKHSHVLANCRALSEICAPTAPASIASWLPPYHDMGLICGFFLPAFMGVPSILMSPLDFLRRPQVWLETISRYRAVISGGPNFAYELAVRKTKPEERERLNLSSWQIAFNGAEPIRARTLRRFAAAFEPAGFSPQALYPCYGLAEATLIVSGSLARAGARIQRFDSAELQRGRVIPLGPAANEETDAGIDLVSSGPSITGQKLAIVDADTCQELGSGRIGEVWVSGPCVASGYWRRMDESAAVFGARLEGHAEPFLRTGDLGFLDGGQLFIAGRIKDLIVMSGRNIYPQDVEVTVEGAHPAVRPGGCAAFAVEGEEDERVVVLAEVDVLRSPSLQEVIASVREAVRERHEVDPAAVVLLRPGTIAKTSSGKIQRSTCKREFLTGGLDAVDSYRSA